jgi:hypothetical protein
MSNGFDVTWMLESNASCVTKRDGMAPDTPHSAEKVVELNGYGVGE